MKRQVPVGEETFMTDETQKISHVQNTLPPSCQHGEDKNRRKRGEAQKQRPVSRTGEPCAVESSGFRGILAISNNPGQLTPESEGEWVGAPSLFSVVKRALIPPCPAALLSPGAKTDFINPPLSVRQSRCHHHST